MGNQPPSSAKILEKLRVDYKKGEKLCQKYGHLGFDPDLRKAILCEVVEMERVKQELTVQHEALRSFESMERLCNEMQDHEEEFQLQMREAVRLGLKGSEEEQRYARLVCIIRSVFRQVGWPDPRCGCSGLIGILLLCFALCPADSQESADKLNEEAVWFALAVVHRLRYSTSLRYFAKEHFDATQKILPRCLQAAKICDQVCDAAQTAVFSAARGGRLKNDNLVRFWDFLLPFGGYGWAGIIVTAAQGISPDEPFDNFYLKLLCDEPIPLLAQAAEYNIKNAAFLQSLVARAVAELTSPADRRLLDVLLAEL